jgi:hypothetical protein
MQEEKNKGQDDPARAGEPTRADEVASQHRDELQLYSYT